MLHRGPIAWEPLALAVLLAVTSLGCNKSGGGGPGITLTPTGRTVLQFVDDCGTPLTRGGGINGLLLGDQLTDARILRAGLDGSVTLNLLPGTYTLQATLHNADGSTTPLAQQLVVPENPHARTLTISLSPAEIEEAWALYRAGDLAGARALLDGQVALAGGVATGAVANALGWITARQGSLGQATGFFDAAAGSGCSGTDALVGHAGVKLLQIGAGPTAQQAEQLLTEAIERPGEYSSAPNHDAISETDLYISRALARWAEGDIAGAQADLMLAQPRVATDANFGGVDLFNMLQLFTSN